MRTDDSVPWFLCVRRLTFDGRGGADTAVTAMRRMWLTLTLSAISSTLLVVWPARLRTTKMGTCSRDSPRWRALPARRRAGRCAPTIACCCPLTLPLEGAQNIGLVGCGYPGQRLVLDIARQRQKSDVASERMSFGARPCAQPH